jgi:hypothetical protein
MSTDVSGQITVSSPRSCQEIRTAGHSGNYPVRPGHCDD